MVSSFLIASLLLALIGSSHSYYDVLRDNFQRPKGNPYLTCNVGDFFCSKDCLGIQLCVANDEIIDVDNCAGEDTANPVKLCDPETLTCVHPALVTTCKYLPDENMLNCHASGFFPNPHDCHSYFDCHAFPTPPPSGEDPTEAPPLYPTEPVSKIMCYPETSAYDPLSTVCRFNASHRVCKENPVPQCKYRGQAGAQKENPNIYYVCVTDPVSGSLIPWLFKCKIPSDVFEGDNCRPSDAKTTQLTT